MRRGSERRTDGADAGGLHARIHAVVCRIPRGRLATYGQVAELAGLPRQARLVGYALHALDEGAAVPWHRVINARGEVSRRSEPGMEAVQRCLLEAEGVRFDELGRVDLGRYRWNPRKGAARRRAGGGERHGHGSTRNRL